MTEFPADLRSALNEAHNQMVDKLSRGEIAAYCIDCGFEWPCDCLADAQEYTCND